MKISEYSLNHLAKAVCGDYSYTPYLKGYELVKFFNRYGIKDNHGSGFPSRWKYSEDSLRELNGTNAIDKIIEEIVDPRRFHGLSIKVEDAILQINDFLKYDKIQLKKAGDFYKIHSIEGSLIQSETIKKINHDFIIEQVNKCQKKIEDEDFNGAITNARSLVEAIFIELIERHNKKEVRNDGDIENQWRQVKRIIKLEIDKSIMPDFVIQILSGIDTSVKGLAGLSNQAGDRHATKFNTKGHHAKLAVNLSMTISEFLLDVWNYQNEKIIK